MDLGIEEVRGLIDYPNVPPLIGMAISGRPQRLAELNTSLSVEDLHNIIEVVTVDAHNRRLIDKHNADKEKR